MSHTKYQEANAKKAKKCRLGYGSGSGLLTTGGAYYEPHLIIQNDKVEELRLVGIRICDEKLPMPT